MHFIGYVYLGASLRRQLRFSYSRKNRKYDYESHNAPVLKSRKWTKRFVHIHYISLLLVLKLTFLDINSMRQSDISFALTLVLHAMSPPNVKSALSGAQNLKVATEIRTGSLYVYRNSRYQNFSQNKHITLSGFIFGYGQVIQI